MAMTTTKDTSRHLPAPLDLAASRPGKGALTAWCALPSVLLRDATAVLSARLLASAAAMMVTPFLVVHLTRELGLAPIVAVLLASVIVIGGRLFARPLGAFVDRWPGPVLPFASLLGCAAATALLLALDSAAGMALAVVACAGTSVAATTFNLAVRAHVARLFDPRHLPLVYAASSVAFNLGMFGGAALAGWLLHLGLGAWTVGSAVAAYGLAAAALMVARRGRTADAMPAEAPVKRGATPVDSPPLPAIVLGPFAWTYAAIGYLTSTVTLLLAAYCTTVLGSTALASVFYSSQSLALVAGLPVVGWLLRRASTGVMAALYFTGQLLAALGFIAFGALPSAGLAVGVLSAAFCLSQALSVPTADPLLASLVGKGNVGRVFGATTSAAAAGALVACFANAAALQWLPPDRLWLAWALPGTIASAVVAGAVARRPWRVRLAAPAPDENGVAVASTR